jgi:uncharacterized membrane protein YgdD (TMEM256/DUF423 family)
MYTLDHKMKRITHLALGAGTAYMILSIIFQAYSVRIPQEDLLYIFEAGVQSQVYQGLGLILLGILSMVIPYNKLFRWGTLLIIAGVILFSGSLYLIALMDTKIPALITPLGGLLLTAGWLTFTVGTFKKPGTTHD